MFIIICIMVSHYQATRGNRHTRVGGEDFDIVLVEHFLNEFNSESDIDLKNDRMAIQCVREAAEKAKIELSLTTQTEINLPFITADTSSLKHVKKKLNHSQFEALVRSLVQPPIEPCKKALNDAGVKAHEINKVILISGMTYRPKVTKTVKRIFGQEPSKGINCDEAVAIGASIQGGVPAGNVKRGQNLEGIGGKTR